MAVAGDDPEARIGAEVHADAAPDDVMIVEQCQPKATRCRISIHAQGGDRRPGGVALILALLSWRSSNSYDFCDYS
ncbi:hypothetical protein [Stenotrophomonas sp.]|uniref:hypothetical protein n=1 Tax=Stenotrophomonas sp. TaxID=69392 RepID=UPI0028AC6C93|nr:hypothetical protein [Stenotrophomonas sp.]